MSVQKFQKLSQIPEKTIAVVGGGIIGASQAYHLSLNPKNRVILIDQHKQCGQATSKANSCMIMYSSTFPYTYKSFFDIFPHGLYDYKATQRVYPFKAMKEPGFFKFFYHWMLTATEPYKYSDQGRHLNIINQLLIKDFITESGIDPISLDYEENCTYSNLYRVDQNLLDSYKKKLQKKYRLDKVFDKEGIQENIISKHPESKNLDYFNLCLPEPITKVNCLRLTQAFQRILENKPNVDVLLGSQVKSVNFNDNQLKSLQLHNSTNPLNVDATVFCLGSETIRFFKKNFGVSIPLQPIKGYSFEFKLRNPQEKTNKIHLKMPQLGVVFTYLQDNIVRVSGCGDIAGLDNVFDYKRIDYMKDITARFFNDYDYIRNNTFNEWYGYRPCTPDDKPLIGMLKNFDNVIINTGHGGRGFTQGVATGKILSDLINDGTTLQNEHYFNPFDLSRFNL